MCVYEKTLFQFGKAPAEDLDPYETRRFHASGLNEHYNSLRTTVLSDIINEYDHELYEYDHELKNKVDEK